MRGFKSNSYIECTTEKIAQSKKGAAGKNLANTTVEGFSAELRNQLVTIRLDNAVDSSHTLLCLTTIMIKHL